MGAVIGILAGGSAAITSKLDDELFGDGERKCKKGTSSYSKFKMPKCRRVSRAQATLRPKLYPKGAGYYVEDQKVPDCRIPNSCRQDCDVFDRLWKGVKRQFTHLNKEGLIKRMVCETCIWKSSGNSCEGVSCKFYKKQADKAYKEYAEKQERYWGKVLDKFSQSPLGKFLNFVPLTGSSLNLVFKDIKAERPNEGDWVSFGTDVAFAFVPGASSVGAAAKAAVKGIAVAGFKQAVKGSVKVAVKTTIRKIITNPLVQKELRFQALKLGSKMAIKALGRALSSDEERMVKTFIYDSLDNRNEKLMEALLKQVYVIPDDLYEKKKAREKLMDNPALQKLKGLQDDKQIKEEAKKDDKIVKKQQKEFGKAKAKEIKKLQRIQAEQDKARLGSEPDARTKLQKKNVE